MWKNRQLLALFFAQLVVNTGFGVIVPVLPYFALNLGAQPFDIGVLLSAYSLMQFVAAPFWGRLSDSVGRKPVLVAGIVGLSASYLLISFSSVLWMAMAARVIGGLMAAAVLPTSFAFVGDTTSHSERGRGMGFIAAGQGVGFIIGPAFGGALTVFGLAVPFLVAFVLALSSAVVAAVFLTEPSTRPVTAPAQVQSPIRAIFLSPVGVVLGLAFLVSLADANRQSTLALYAKDVFQFGGAEVGLVFTVMGIVFVGLQGIVVGPLIDRLGDRRMLLLGLPLSAVGFALVLTSWDLFSLTVAIAFQGAGMAFTYTSIPTLISKEARSSQGTAMGLRSASQSGGQILGPLFGGWAYKLDRTYPYIAGAGFMVLALLVGWFSFEAWTYLKSRRARVRSVS